MSAGWNGAARIPCRYGRLLSAGKPGSWRTNGPAWPAPWSTYDLRSGRRGGSGQGRGIVDASTKAPRCAAMRRDTGRLPGDAGVACSASRHPREDLARLDPAQGARLSNQRLGLEDPDAKIAKMKAARPIWPTSPRHAAGWTAGAWPPSYTRPTRATERWRRRWRRPSLDGRHRAKTRRMCDRQGLSLTVGLKDRRHGSEDADLERRKVLRASRRRGGPPGSHQQPDPAVIEPQHQGSLQARARSSAPLPPTVDRGGMRRT